MAIHKILGATAICAIVLGVGGTNPVSAEGLDYNNFISLGYADGEQEYNLGSATLELDQEDVGLGFSAMIAPNVSLGFGYTDGELENLDYEVFFLHSKFYLKTDGVNPYAILSWADLDIDGSIFEDDDATSYGVGIDILNAETGVLFRAEMTTNSDIDYSIGLGAEFMWDNFGLAFGIARVEGEDNFGSADGISIALKSYF
jgi:hypothetical protein